MPLAGTFHQIDGVRVHCRESGQGEPLLLIHGYLVSQRCWEQITATLGRHFTLIAVDLPGFGESDRPGCYPYTLDAFAGTLAGLMDALGIPRARLMGHSLGATVALALAAWFPERIQRLLAAAPAVYTVPLPGLAQGALLPLVGEALFTRLLSRRTLRAYLREVYLDPSLPSEQTLGFYWERVSRPGGRLAAYRTLRTLAALDEQRQLPRQVRTPVQIVVGEEDRLCPMGNCRRLQLELSEAGLAQLPGCGHAPMEERPETFCAAALPFLQGAAPADAVVR